MPRLQRSSPLVTIAAAGAGAVVGYVVQLALSGRGNPPFVPPYSLPGTLLVISAVLLVLAFRLARALKTGTGPVNPFFAVRLLAAARASQLVGGMFGGFGVGLALSLLGRSVPAAVATWLPMVAVVVTGAVLVAAAVYAEHTCRVPPDDDTPADDPDPDAGPVDQAAYRRRD